MNILVTAGNTQTPIDQVRCITNVFTGRTGAGIALEAQRRGHQVTLLTSHPEAVAALQAKPDLLNERWRVRTYRTFAELADELGRLLRRAGLDAVIHAAAVSDYETACVYARAPNTVFDVAAGGWGSVDGREPKLIDVSAGKIKSDAPELWLRLVRTPKLIDKFRTDWGFAGVLVKFKLEVGIGEERLLEIAERSRQQSTADLMVANTLEGAGTWALLGPVAGRYEKVSRQQLPSRLLEEIEELHRNRSHG